MNLSFSETTNRFGFLFGGVGDVDVCGRGFPLLNFRDIQMVSVCFVLFLLLNLSIPLRISQANTTVRI